MTPNRIVAIASTVIALALAVLPVVANMDWSSTAGVIAGIVAVLTIALKWLDGHQQFARDVGHNPSLIGKPPPSPLDLPVPEGLKVDRKEPDERGRRAAHRERRQ